MKEIRLGTIGSGAIVHSILDGVKVTEGIGLEAVYSRTMEKGRKLADEYGAGKVYTDIDEMCEDPDVNFIYVASPNSLHYQHARTALMHGKNVICEKPFCTRKEDLLELIALAEEKGLFLVDATVTAFLPNFEELKQHLEEIGRVRLVLCSYSQYSSRYDKVLEGEYPNVFTSEYAGGCMQDINYYNVYFNIALFGKPENAVYYPNMCGGGVDTSGVMVMKYPDFISDCSAAKDTWGVNMAQIQGEKGFICVENGSNGIEKVRVVTKTSDTTYNLQDNPDRWFYEIQNLTPLLLADDYQAIRDRMKVTVDVIDTIEQARRQAGILFPGDQ